MAARDDFGAEVIQFPGTARAAASTPDSGAEERSTRQAKVDALRAQLEARRRRVEFEPTDSVGDTNAAARRRTAQRSERPLPAAQSPAVQSPASARNITALPGVHGDPSLLEDASDALVRALARAAKSEHEALTLLREQFEELGEADRAAIIDRMRELNYLDDARLAAQLRDGRFARKQLGRAGMARELRARGISDIVIDETIGNLDRDDEFERALSLARTRAARSRGLDWDTAYRRIHGYLARRGFSGELISRAVRQALDE